MTPEDALAMALDDILCFLAGEGFPTPQEGYDNIDHALSDLKRWRGTLVAIEREACARLVEECHALGLTEYRAAGAVPDKKQIAAAIRQRGKQ